MTNLSLMRTNSKIFLKYLLILGFSASSVACGTKTQESEAQIQQALTTCLDAKHFIETTNTQLEDKLDKIGKQFIAGAEAHKEAIKYKGYIEDKLETMMSDVSWIAWYTGYASDFENSMYKSTRDTSYLKFNIEKLDFPFANKALSQTIEVCQSEETPPQIQKWKKQISECPSILYELKSAGHWFNAELSNSYSYARYASSTFNNARWEENANQRSVYFEELISHFEDFDNNEYKILKQRSLFAEKFVELHEKCLVK